MMSKEEYEDFLERLKSDYGKKKGHTFSVRYYEHLDTTIISFHIKGRSALYE